MKEVALGGASNPCSNEAGIGAHAARCDGCKQHRPKWEERVEFLGCILFSSGCSFHSANPRVIYHTVACEERWRRRQYFTFRSLQLLPLADRPTCRLPIRRDAQLDSPFVFLPPEHSLSLSTSYRACFSIMNFRRSCFLLDVRAGEKRKACCYCNLRLDLLSGGRIDGGPLYELCRCQEGVSPRVPPDPPHFRPRSELQGGPRASIILLVIH